MANSFPNRVYGCAIVKAINSNYNADFSHQPRTLPDGTAYATDKAFKYLMRNFWTRIYPEEKVLYFKRFNQNMNPFTLDEAYSNLFGKANPEAGKGEVLKNLLSSLDVKLFGATFANKGNKKENIPSVSISIHGPLQIGHGVNRYPESLIFPEQIMSPFRDDKEGKGEADASTLGTQYKLAEGHYVHHFSLNPSNLDAHLKRLGETTEGITPEDVEKLKQAMRSGATYFDSSAKAGIDNELLLWVQLKPEAKVVLPTFTQLVKVERRNPQEKTVIDLSDLTALLASPRYEGTIDKIELYYDQPLTEVKGAPESAETFAL